MQRLASKSSRLAAHIFAFTFSFTCAQARAGDQCQPAWLPALGQQPGVEAEVGFYPGGSEYDGLQDFAVFDDGSGPALYAAGWITGAGGQPVAGVARWDGERWSAVGTGLVGVNTTARVRCLEVYDDGTGPALYAGGRFNVAGFGGQRNLARWDGQAWSAAGGGVGGAVHDLVVYDDGSGAALIAGGEFNAVGGATAADNIARWNGSTWSALGIGTDSAVYALEVFDDGNGLDLYAGGLFQTAGGNINQRLARWDGNQWSGVGGGLGGVCESLAVYDDGNGPALYAGGSFGSAGLETVFGVARWSGTAWSSLDQGVESAHASIHAYRVNSLAVYDDGSGPSLYVAGDFAGARGGGPRGHTLEWDGTQWLGMGLGIHYEFSEVHALAVFDEGQGPALFVGGELYAIGEFPGSFDVENIIRWQGDTWSRVGSGVGALGRTVVFDDGSGAALYWVGEMGTFEQPGLRKWLGDRWSEPYFLFHGVVRDLAVYDDGFGPQLYIGGRFGSVDGQVAQHLIRFDGVSWEEVGGGLPTVGVDVGDVHALEVFDDGSGSSLFVGGAFEQAGSLMTKNVARWDGQAWHPLDQGIEDAGGFFPDPTVHDFAIHDDGNGPALYVVGADLWIASGVPVQQVARWDGSTWSAVGGLPLDVNAVASVDLGQGPILFAGGTFGIRQWTGVDWVEVAGGVDNWVQRLVGFRDGQGPALFAGGYFETAGGVPAPAIARFDGTQWSNPGVGLAESQYGGPRVFDLDVFPDPLDSGNDALVVCGDFSVASPSGDSNVALWGGCPGDAMATSTFCDPAPPNSSGLSTRLVATLDTGLGSGLHLDAFDGPPNQLGIVIVGSAAQQPGVPFGNGELCLVQGGGNVIGRYGAPGTALASLGAFDAAGVFQNLSGTSTTGLGFDVPIQLPLPGLPQVAPGDSWNFQLWHRDVGGTFHLSQGVKVFF